jgi:hypothetical protein
MKEPVMGLPMDRTPDAVPRLLPVGAKYVVEGFGGGEGNLRVVARYLLLPDGHRINVPADLSRPPSARTVAFRRNLRPTRRRSSKKLTGRRGTG